MTFAQQVNSMGRVGLQFWRPVPVVAKDLNVGSVGTTMSRGFPFMNLEGLAGVNGLSVMLSSKPFNLFPGVFVHMFSTSREAGCPSGGRAMFYMHPFYSELQCMSYFPELPAKANLGATLMALILSRGNTFTKYKVTIVDVNRKSLEMVRKMTGFAIKERMAGGGRRKDVDLTVPMLTQEELTAVEWYWRNVLHLGSE